MSVQSGTNNRGIGSLIKYSDIALAVGVVVIIGMMIIPLPTALLDTLLTVNITAALTVLLVSMYIKGPLQFSAFPAGV